MREDRIEQTPEGERTSSHSPPTPRSLEIVGEGGRFSVRVDGKEVRYVTSLTLRMSAEGEIPKATIEVIAINAYVKLDETEVEIVPKVITT